MKKDTIDKQLLIHEYSLKIHKMEIGFSNLREELNSKGFNDNEIDLLIKRIDHKVLKIAQIESQVSKGKSELFMGLLLTIAGLVVTIGTYIGFIDLGNHFLVLYGPIAAGITLVADGKRKVNMKNLLNAPN